jgi:hypothetical protein
MKISLKNILSASILSTTLLALQSTIALADENPVKPKICVVEPKAQLGQGDSGIDVSEPVRTSLIAYLSGPAADLAPLTALVPAQYNIEARQAQCNYILTSSVTQKKSKFGGLMKIASIAAPMAGMAGGMSSSAGGMAAAQAAAIAGSMAQQKVWEEQAKAQIFEASQSNVHKGDKIHLEYVLSNLGDQSVGSAASKVKPSVLEAKATADGEDVLSSLLELAATQILTVVIK